MASIMQQANTIRTALSQGNGLSFGAWQMLPGSHLSRTIARSGFDWVLIDCEHGNISGEHMFVPISEVADLVGNQIMRCMSLYMPSHHVE